MHALRTGYARKSGEPLGFRPKEGTCASTGEQRRDKHVTPAAISPPGVARGRFFGGQQSGLAGCKLPPLFTHETSSCSSQGRRQGEPRGASPRPSAPTHLPASPLPFAAMPGGSACCIADWCSPPVEFSIWGGPAPGVVFLSAAGVPPFPLWLPPWAPRVVAGLAVRAPWLGRLSVAPPLGRGLPTRAAARASFPGLRAAARQPGRWCVPGLGSGQGWGPGDREMTVLWAIPPARLVGRGATGTPVGRVLGPASGLAGSLCWSSPEPGDWSPRWGCGRRGARCRRAGGWWCRSG